MAGTPNRLAKTPAVQPEGFDVLTDVLGVIRLSGSIMVHCHLSTPWAFQTPPLKQHPFSPVPKDQHALSFHLVMEGHAWVETGGGPRYELEAGDMVILPFGSGHTMGNGVTKTLVSPTEVAIIKGDGRIPKCQYGGGGELTRIICGFLQCDELLFNPLCKGLPPLIHLKTRGKGAMAMMAGTLEHILDETQTDQIGGGHMLSRLTEVLFIEAMRQYLLTLPAGQVGWLAALNAPLVGDALRCMHADPARAWTVDSLSRQIGCSRSLLAARFKELLGQPPMQYLANWRLQLAADMLRNGADITTVATQVGYSSEAAFNRAFKRHLGEPPASWRSKNEDKAAA